MPNMVSYARNLAKSAKYATIDVMKEMNPVIVSLYETNNDVIKDVYNAVTDLKGTTSNIRDNDTVSKVGALAKTYYQNLRSDLRTGKFYNKERKEEYDNGIDMVGGDYSDEDFGIDFGDNEDFEISSDSSSSKSSSSLSFNDMDEIAEKQVNATGEIIARSAQYQVEAQRQSTNAMLNQNAEIFGRMHSNLGVINSNLSLVINYLKESSTTHYNNSKTFYETSTNLLQESNSMLKELLELEKKRYTTEERSRSSNNKREFSDIFDSNGAIDLKEYAEMVKDNLMSGGSGIGSMLKDYLDNGAIKSMFAASPLEGLMKGVINTAIPRLLKDGMAEINQSIAGAMGSIVTKLGSYDEGGIMGSIIKILGFTPDSLKKSLETSNYNKGAVPFDGVTRKAIIEVIPTYLSKIYSTVSGKEENRFNYETGKFTTVSKLKKEMDDIYDMYRDRSSGDIRRTFNQMKKSINFKGDEEREKAFEDDMKAFFDYHFRNAKVYNKKTGASTYGMKSQYSEENLALIQKMWERLPKSMRLQWASEIQDSRSSYNKYLRNMETESLNPLIALYNGSLDQDDLDEAASHSRNRRRSGSTNRTRRNGSSPVRQSSGSSNTSSTVATVDENELSRIAREEGADYISDFTSDNRGWFGESDGIIGKKLKQINRSKPVSLIGSIFNKVDSYLYDFVFGNDEFENDKNDNGFLNATINQMKGTFNKLNTWLEINIFNPLRNKFTKENAHKAASKLFAIFGINLDDTVQKTKEYLFGDKKDKTGLLGGFFKDIKESFKGTGDYIKDSFKSVFDYFNIFGIRNEKGNEKQDRNKIRTKIHSKFLNSERRASDINEALNGLNGVGSVEPENAAEGMRRVSKTGVIVASEGELIIPPDMNPFNIRKRYKEENKQKSKFLDSIQNFDKGGTVRFKTSKVDTSKNNISEEQKKHNEKTKQEIKQRFERIIAEKAAKEKTTRDDFEEGEESILFKMYDETQNLVESIKGAAKYLLGGTDAEEIKSKMSDDFNNMTSDVMQNIRKYAPDMVTGGVIGAGVSLVTGMIGGPLLGAAAGASIGLIKNSKAVQKWLFGDIDENGEREGGILSKNISKNIQKYFPDMAKGATVGAITSILPFVPGGPVAGIIIGSSIGFAKNNEKIQNALFGDEGILKGFPQKVKKVLPRMGVGAAAGLIAGPFGVATNVILGSALGFATDTNAFKEAVFGKENEDGVREGGLLQVLKDQMVEPSKEFFSNMFKDFKTWFDKDIKANVKDFIDPFNKRIEMFIQGTISTIGKVFEFAADKFMKTKVGKAVDRITGASLGLIGKVAGFGRGVVGLPFKFLGATGRRWRSIDISKGRATYMSAQERLNYAQSNKFKRGILRQRNRDYELNEFDQTLAGLSDDEVSELNTNMQYIKNAKKTAAKEKKMSIRNLSSLKKVVGSSQYRGIMTALEAGNIDQAVNIANTLRETYTDEKGNIVSIDKAGVIKLIQREGNRYKRSLNASKNQEQALQDAKKYLEKKGIKYTDKNLSKLLDYTRAEDKFRNGSKNKGYEQKSNEEIALETATKRHNEIVDLFNKAIKNLEELNKTSDKQLEEDQKDREERIRFDTEDHTVTDEPVDANYREIQKPNRKGVRGLFDKARNKVSSMIRNRIPQSEAEVEDENPNVKYSFVNGFAMKFIRTKQNGWSADKSDSDTMAATRQMEENQETQKGILSSLTSIPGKIFSFFGGDKQEESGDKKESIFSKILKGATKVAVLGGLVMFAPKIYKFFEDKVAPIFTGIKDGFLNGWNHTGEQLDTIPEKIGNFFGDHLNTGVTFITDFLMGQGQFEGKGMPYLFEDKIIPAMCSGFELLMSSVAPYVVRTFAKALPSLIKSGILGLKDFFVGVFKGEGNTKPSYGSTTTTIDKVSVNSKINYKPSGSWTSGSNTVGENVKSSSLNSSNYKSYTDEERNENSKEIRKTVNNNDYDITSIAPQAIGRSFAMGRTTSGILSKAGTITNKAGKALSKASGVVSKVPGLKLAGWAGKAGGAALKLAGKGAKALNSVIDGAGTLGGYILPTSVVGADNKNKALTEVSNIKEKITGIVDTAKNTRIGKFGTKVLNKVKDTTIGKGIYEMGNNALDKLKETAKDKAESGSKGIIKKLTEFISKHLPKALTDNKIVNFVYNKFKSVSKNLTKEALQKTLKEFAEKIVAVITKKLGEKAGELTGKAIAKITATVASGGIAFIAFAVISFINGWKQADELLNITDPGVIQRLVSGVIMIVNDNLCFGLLPLNWLYEQFLDIAEKIPFFSSSIKNIREKQKETEEERDKYNLENGTNLTTDEYIQYKKQEKSVLYKAKTAIVGAGKSIGSGIKKALFGETVSAATLTDEQQKQLNQNQATVSTLNTMVGTSTVSALQNANDTMSNLVNEMDNSLDQIDKEHDQNKKNTTDITLKNYWKTKKRNTGKGIGAVLTNFITMTEKALLFPITLMNSMLSNANDYTTNTNNSTNNSSSNTNTGNASSNKSSTTTKKKGILSSAINGVKNFASGIWSGVKSLFSGKGSGISNPQPEPYDISKPVSEYTSNDDLRSLKKNGLFVSQLDSTYSNRPFQASDDTEKHTVGESGCAPAAATMAINLANKGGFTNKTQTFDASIRNARKYKLADQGVTADYFIDEFKNNNLSTAFVSSEDSNMSDSIKSLLRNNHPIVLIGSDGTNTSKSKSPFGPNGHYVVATGLSEDGKKIYINDPESKKPNSVYDTDAILKSVSLGIAPVRKDSSLDMRTKNSQVSKYLRSVKASGLSGSSNREKIWNFLRSKGCSEQCAAGIIGNLMQEAETTVNPGCKQSGGPGRGICQWTYGSDRWNGLMSVCNSMGVSWDNLEAQCVYMWQEMQSESTWISKLKSSYGMTVNQFTAVTDIDKATRAFCTCFERAGTSVMSNRIKYAKQTYEEFSGKKVSGSSDGLTANGNVNFKKWDLSEDQYQLLANYVESEQPDTASRYAEASLMANLADLNYNGDIIKAATGGWFAAPTQTGSADTVNIVKKVVHEGKRTLPKYIDEHDMYNPGGLTDVNRIEGPGTFEDRNSWVAHQTEVYQDPERFGGSGSHWTFYEFPSSQSDPFGYSNKENRTKYGDGHYDLDGNAIGSTTDGTSADAAASSEPAWKNPKSILDIFTVFDTLAQAYGLSSYGDSSSSSSSSNSSSSGTAVTGNANELQKKLANVFIKSENAIPNYSNENRYDFTISDDGKMSGNSVDCSAAVEKAYQKVLNVDPGSWSGAMDTSGELTTVEKGSGTPGSDGPTISKMQLGDIVLYGKNAGTHAEMFTGKSDKGYTMGAGSAPAPHWDKGSDVNGKLSDWHTQNSGFWSVKRYKGFDGSSSSTDTSSSNVVSGEGSGLLKKFTKKHISKLNERVKNRIFVGKGSGMNTDTTSTKAENIISSASKTTKTYNITPKVYTKTNTGTNVSPAYNYTNTTSTVNNMSSSSNSEQLLSMLKAIISILVKIVDNSENMKQIVSLLTQLVSAVADNKNSGTTSKQKTDDIAQLKLNLVNTLNNATSSSADQELMNIINQLDTIASL